ncbi:UNVERIFIED_CONTAM: hypothetical protein FKN15_012817 [Acipenser sinensis]
MATPQVNQWGHGHWDCPGEGKRLGSLPTARPTRRWRYQDESAARSPPQPARRYVPGISACPTTLLYPLRAPLPATVTAVCEPPPGLPGSGLGLALEDQRSGAECLKEGEAHWPPVLGAGSL